MRTRIGRGKRPLVSNLITCGGDKGPHFEITKRIQAAADGIYLDEVVPMDAKYEQVLSAFFELDQVAKEHHAGIVTAEAVLEQFGLRDHFVKMSSQASVVAIEMPDEVKNVAHLMLPVKDGVYSNQGVVLPIRNFVEIGPQAGNLVVHLGGCFSSGCSKSYIEQVLYEQAKIPGFLQLVDSLNEIDYAKYPFLMKNIKAAKSKLDL